MNTKCILLLAAIFQFLTARPQAHRYRFYNDKYNDSDWLVEFGASVGAINCLTDLGGNAGVGKKFFKDVNWVNTQFCKSFSIGASYKEIFGLRFEATLGNINAYDSILKSVAPSTFGRYERNLSFRSSIAEIAIITEFHPLLLFNFSDRNAFKFSPYILLGIGNFSFNPQAYLKGNWIDLSPLHLEGQGFKEYPNRPNYSLNATCYPIGFGLKYEIANFFVARFEFIHRFTNTDYLDDDSQGEYVKPELFDKYLTPRNAALAKQLYYRSKELNPNYSIYPGQIRGQSNNNDAYFSINLKVDITLGREKIK